MTTFKIHLSTTATTSQTGVCQHLFSADLQHDAADVTCEIFCGSHSGVLLPHFDVASWYFQQRWSRRHDSCKREDKLKPSRSRIARTPRNFFSRGGQRIQKKCCGIRWPVRKLHTTETFGETMMLPSGSSSLIFIVDGVCSFFCVQRSIGTWLAT